MGGRAINLDENSATGSSFRSVRSFEGEFVSEPCPRLKSEETFQNEAQASSVDWACTTITLDSNERLEHERLQKVESELIGRVIEAYERALQNGLRPNRAIASMLEWASLECPRLLP